MRLLKFIIFFPLLALNNISNAESYSQGEILTIDKSIPNSLNLEFSNSNDLEPKIGEFKVLSSILMSNLSGQRWATITIKNRSSHQRLLDREHIMAIFANGEKRNPIQAKHKFSREEEKTMIINFGESKFPILKIEMKN